MADCYCAVTVIRWQLAFATAALSNINVADGAVLSSVVKGQICVGPTWAKTVKNVVHTISTDC